MNDSPTAGKGSSGSSPPIAGFEVDLRLDAVDGDQTEKLAAAAKAVRQEFRESSKWKRLNCRRVSVYSERDRGTVFVIQVGGAVDFDWTWEGAVAFRPRSIDNAGMLSDDALEHTVGDDEVLWSGEILEVDELNRCLFVSVDDPDRVPTTGAFLVRPFEFLSVLDAVYNGQSFEREQENLPARLAATEGGVHPQITGSDPGFSELKQLWNHSWSVLWGPPGTGKTYTTGRQVASVLARDRRERILVVSTTNKATDGVARSIGNAARELANDLLSDGQLLRIGKGVTFQDFADDDLIAMVQGTESDALVKIDRLAKQLQTFDSIEEKALARRQIADLKTSNATRAGSNFTDPEVRCIVSTAFKAMSMLRRGQVSAILEQGQAPFTTIIIDEAGLISRAALAALSLLAAERVILVGDSKQLAPISRISRVLPYRQKNWLASSGLSHLDELDQLPDAVHLLSEQRRMHPDVCSVVSDYQYAGRLTTATDRAAEESNLPRVLEDFSRTIWYVPDADASDLASIRAERGPGNQSWIRTGTLGVLQKLFAWPELQQCHGLFISPYKGQARLVSDQLAKWKLKTWQASTVHSQQGAEADVVVFDTVNAASYNWPFEEWKRLVNVALSRAREAVIVLASRSEMEEPYLSPLVSQLKPGYIETDVAQGRWREIDSASIASWGKVNETKTLYRTKLKTNSFGKQFEQRSQLKPVLTKEQQRLSNLKLDGKPRLVRGVAGSGKSVVLCNWLARTVHRLQPDSEHRVWAVYANRSLHKLLRQSIESAWEQIQLDSLFGQQPFPWEHVELLHVKDLLAGILPEASLSMERFEFDYDRASEEFLNRHDAQQLLPRCAALFIDEAQDMGPATLRLLLSLVEQADPDDSNSRSAHIFYDNAQNIYGRQTPTWSEFGLDMRGRSTIMRDSFRSTKPVTEFAVNVLDKLTPADRRDDQLELQRLGLIERTERGSDEWLSVNYNQVHGPPPIFHGFENRNREIEMIGKHIRYLVLEESVRPTDICIIYNGQAVADELQLKLSPLLAKLGIELSLQTSRSFERNENTVVLTTSHSFKGYESEVVIIPAVDRFVTATGEILATNLYVAMTRARSLLAIYGVRDAFPASAKIVNTIERVLQQLSAKLV